MPNATTAAAGGCAAHLTLERRVDDVGQPMGVREMDEEVDGATRDWLTGRSRRDVSRRRILHAATQLIVERGAAQLGAEDVCARVGCSRATLYRHVGGRPAILAAVVTQRGVPVLDAVRRAAAPFDGDERVVETILGAVKEIRADPILSDALKHVDRRQIDECLAVPESVSRGGSHLAVVAPRERIAATLMVRIVLSLVDYPLAEPDEEREVATQFARVFRPT